MRVAGDTENPVPPTTTFLDVCFSAISRGKCLCGADVIFLSGLKYQNYNFSKDCFSIWEHGPGVFSCRVPIGTGGAAVPTAAAARDDSRETPDALYRGEDFTGL